MQSGFLEDWRFATVIPIPKPGKDHAEPTNYRPIALTNCLCKTMERMINKRLIWYLESTIFYHGISRVSKLAVVQMII